MTVTAKSSFLKTSPQKLNLIAKLVRGKSVEEAQKILMGCARRASSDVKKVLDSAAANAENNQGLDVDDLYVAHAYVGKKMQLKRFRARARGRGARIIKHFSFVTIELKQKVQN